MANLFLCDRFFHNILVNFFLLFLLYIMYFNHFIYIPHKIVKIICTKIYRIDRIKTGSTVIISRNMCNYFKIVDFFFLNSIEKITQTFLNQPFFKLFIFKIGKPLEIVYPLKVFFFFFENVNFLWCLFYGVLWPHYKVNY